MAAHSGMQQEAHSSPRGPSHGSSPTADRPTSFLCPCIHTKLRSPRAASRRPQRAHADSQHQGRCKTAVACASVLSCGAHGGCMNYSAKSRASVPAICSLHGTEAESTQGWNRAPCSLLAGRAEVPRGGGALLPLSTRLRLRPPRGAGVAVTARWFRTRGGPQRRRCVPAVRVVALPCTARGAGIV